jgi:HK97 family phage prohead protease|tara:strand:- start:927 stop:1544 length:618 start_codon:yes stop_codon:yes gene_type:complete
MQTKFMEVPILEFKYDETKGEFECYVNTKHNIDHAGDRPMDGCYSKSIAKHMADNTKPKMLWSHNPAELPVGTWTSMKEDSKGLRMSGILLPTTMGKDIKILAEGKALDSFSIGYREIKAKWNESTKTNDLYELDIKEASWVNFACDENAQLESIKSNMALGELPSKRELQNILRQYRFSKSQAEKIVNHYDPTEDIFEIMAKLP